jgi:glycerophosphoryl diester phosphodiesterase
MFIGHRGLGTNRHNPPEQENTIASLVAAASLPHVEGVEFDVHLLSDGSLVVYHDFQQNQRHLHQGKATDFPDLPNLDSVLNALAPLNTGVICEIKFPTTSSDSSLPLRSTLAESVVHTLAKFTHKLRFVSVSSFDPEVLVEVKKTLDRTKLGGINVLFNCWFGHEEDGWNDHDFNDIRNRDPITALEFAKTLSPTRVPTIVVETKWLRANWRWFSKRAKIEGVQIFTYGEGNDNQAFAKEQTDIWGVSVVIIDRADKFLLPK